MGELTAKSVYKIKIQHPGIFSDVDRVKLISEYFSFYDLACLEPTHSLKELYTMSNEDLRGHVEDIMTVVKISL